MAVFMATAACGSSSAPAPSAPAVTTPTQFVLSGTVKDSVSGSLISGAQVMVVDGGSKGRTATTDAAGNYSLASLSPGEFTIQISAMNYTTQFQAVTLTTDTTVVIPLVRIPSPFLVLASPSLNQAYCLDPPSCDNINYSFKARNAGTGCAGSISGHFLLMDANRLRIADLPFTLPAATVIRPEQTFFYDACCTSLEIYRSWRTFDVVWSSTAVTC